MPFSVKCPACGKQHRLDDELRGKRVQCPCGKVMAISADVPRQQRPASPSAESTITCSSCGRQHETDASMAGMACQCPCGGIVHVPGATGLGGQFRSAPAAPDGLPPMDTNLGAALDDLSAAELSGSAYPSLIPSHLEQGYPGQMAPAGYPPPGGYADPGQPPQQHLSDDQLLASYMKDDSWKQPDQYSQSTYDDGAFAFEGRILNGGVIGGMLAMIAGILLFIIPLLCGWIVPYSLVLVVIGMIAVVRGVVS